MSTNIHRHNLAGYFFFTLSITLIACGEKVVDLDKKGAQTTTYEALPKEVQSILDNAIDSGWLSLGWGTLREHESDRHLFGR